jgi:hypothetical protein
MQGGTIAVGFAGNPNEPTAVRGGPMFEFLFGIDTQLRREGRRERFELVFFNPSKEPGARLGAKAVQHLLAEMARRITTHLGHKMVRFEADKVVTEGGEFAADLILFMPGMTGNAWFDAHRPAALTRRPAAGRRPVPRAGFRAASMWWATPAASPAPTGCPSRRTWPTCRLKSEFTQHAHQPTGIFRAAANPDVEIAGMARPAMQRHRIAAHHEVFNPASV